MVDLEQALNTEQRQVVLEGNGPCLVLAGAGSGKTRTITYRVAHLLAQGVKPDQILLVTFTNKAAREMVQRVMGLTGMTTPLPWAGTFHHICYRLLRRHAAAVGLVPGFVVLDSEDSSAIMKRAVKAASIPTGIKIPTPRVLLGMISFARNAGRDLAEVVGARFATWENIIPTIEVVARAYAAEKQANNVLDFDDLLWFTRDLFRLPEFGERYGNQFQYVLVDEYQDTNRLQADIIKLVAVKQRNILVVGDDAQSIYSFRAADIQNILSFTVDYSDAKIFRLETNYRSSPEILSVANDVITNNREQFPKQLRAILPSAEAPIIQPLLDEAGEAEYVVKQIEIKLALGIPPKEIAVLFRAASHSERLELVLTRAGIPYDYRGGVRFLERAHIKDVLAFIRLLVNHKDSVSWQRLLLHEEGIGPAAAEKIIASVKRLPAEATRDMAALVAVGDVLSEKARAGWQNFLTVWERVVPEAHSVAGVTTALLTSSYRDYLDAEYLDSRDRQDDIKELANFAATFSSLEEFVAEASLQESFRPGDKKYDGAEKIVLSTIHQAKGLEWEVVFVLRLNDGAFPNERALSEESGLEEERRLFYVAVTRARRYLYLTYPMGGGNGWGDRLMVPSSFLSEISGSNVEDRSLLIKPSSVFSTSTDSEVRYVPDESLRPFKPGSFLRDIDDL